MTTEGVARRGRWQSRARAAGASKSALLAVLLVAVLTAGWSIRTHRLAAPANAEARAEPGPRADASEPGSRVDASTLLDDPLMPFLTDRTAAGQVDAIDHEPAIVRAAEAGLQRLRVQFGATADARESDAAEGRVSVDRGAASIAGTASTDADAPRPERVEIRDTRDPRAARDAGREPEAPPPPKRSVTLPASASTMRAVPAEGSVTLIGEATVLVRSHGMTILTDPNFLRRGERARLAPGFSAARRADPAIDLDELPPIDAIVVSRLREDHFDRLARRKLPRDVPIVAPAEARAELVAMGFSSVHALPSWGELRIARGDTWLRLTATPTRMSPALMSSLMPASMGTLMEFGRDEHPPAYRIWISGDTVVDDALADALAPRLGVVDLALMHVGGATVLGLGGSMDAAAGMRAVKRLAPLTAIPLRLDDFGVAPVPARPLSVAAQASVVSGAPAMGIAPRVRLLERGDTHRFAPLQHWAQADGEMTARP